MDKLLTIIKATEENLLNFLKAVYNLEDILYDFESACMCWMAEIDVIENSKKSIDIDKTLFYLINDRFIEFHFADNKNFIIFLNFEVLVKHEDYDSINAYIEWFKDISKKYNIEIKTKAYHCLPEIYVETHIKNGNLEKHHTIAYKNLF